MYLLKEWHEATEPAIAELSRIAEKRRQAIRDLLRMQLNGMTLSQLTESSIGLRTEGEDYPNDPTHYLEDTDAWLQLVNKMCTDAGVRAIGLQVQQCMNGIKNLQLMDGCFTGSGKINVLPAEDGTSQACDVNGAWSFLQNNVLPYIQQERDNDIQIRMAGYE